MIRHAIHLTTATVLLLLFLGCDGGQPDEAVERETNNVTPQLVEPQAKVIACE